MSVKPLLDTFRDYLSLREDAPVQEWFSGFDWRLNERNLTPVQPTGVRHLPLTAGSGGKMESRLVESFIAHAPQLNWLRSYGPEDFGQYFFDNYAHVEIFGTRGHFACEELAGGIILYGPNIDYPNHWHVAEEIYIPLTGGGLWSSDNADYLERAAGEFVYHESNMPHAIRTGEKPVLALWVWRAGDLAQKGNY